MAPDRGFDAQDAATLQHAIKGLDLVRDLPSGVQTPDPTLEANAQPIPPHLSHDPASNAKRTDPFQFGQRYLSEQDDVFEYNAWDHVTPDEEHLAFAEEQYAKQRAAPVSAFDYRRFNDAPDKWWDLFYRQKSATFFKDRKWLVQEFPVLGEVTRRDAGPKVVLEVGAGAGNTAFPVMRMNANEQLEVVAADFSKKAVETMRNAEDYAATAGGTDGRVGTMRAEVWDIAGQTLPEGMREQSADVVIMIFIFSALNPNQWQKAVRNVWRLLKPGGVILFRDYGRGDLAQVRFKAGRWMEENFYVRGDGTRVYFFEKDELHSIWSGEHWQRPHGRVRQHEDKLQGQTSEAEHDDAQDRKPGDDDVEGSMPRFDILDLDVDRRLIVNRQRRIKMYRCWIQGRFRKPEIVGLDEGGDEKG